MKHSRIAGFTLLMAAVSGGGCGSSKFPVAVNGGQVSVDCQTLGEYPSTVTKIILKEKQSGLVLWEVRRVSGTPQLHKIVVRKGENSGGLEAVSSGVLSTVVPGSGGFKLVPQTEYDLTVWGESERPAAQQQFAFKE